MNILIQCNQKNYPEIEILLYSTQQFNRFIKWYIILLEDLTDKQKRKLQQIVKYLDFSSNVILINYKEESLDKQFPYVDHLLCLNSSVISCEPIEQYYNEWIQTGIPILLNWHPNGNKAIIFINLQVCRNNNFHPMLTKDFNIKFIGTKAPYEILPNEFGYCGDFYMPIDIKLIYLDENHPRILDVDENYWCRIYAQFSYIIERLKLIDTINF